MSAVLENIKPADAAATPAPRKATSTLEPGWVRIALIVVALLFLTLFLFVPLVAVFFEALKHGWTTYKEAVVEPGLDRFAVQLRPRDNRR